MSFNLLIVEDEPLVAKRLSRLSAKILGEQLSAQYSAPDVAAARSFITNHTIDLILLDLNLVGSDGFDLLKEFTAKAAHTIVVSAETNRALEAFEFGVLDFVPKPFTQDRLAKALARFWKPELAAEPATSQIGFEAGGGIDIISVSDILYFKGADKYSEATLTSGTVRFHTKSLNRLEDILSASFVRSHKSYLVQRSAIKTLRSLEGSRYELDLNNGGSLPVGRTRVDHVRRALAANNDASDTTCGGQHH